MDRNFTAGTGLGNRKVVRYRLLPDESTDQIRDEVKPQEGSQPVGETWDHKKQFTLLDPTPGCPDPNRGFELRLGPIIVVT